jgi:hypothetical protein
MEPQFTLLMLCTKIPHSICTAFNTPASPPLLLHHQIRATKWRIENLTTDFGEWYHNELDTDLSLLRVCSKSPLNVVHLTWRNYKATIQKPFTIATFSYIYPNVKVTNSVLFLSGGGGSCLPR